LGGDLYVLPYNPVIGRKFAEGAVCIAPDDIRQQVLRSCEGACGGADQRIYSSDNERVMFIAVGEVECLVELPIGLDLGFEFHLLHGWTFTLKQINPAMHRLKILFGSHVGSFLVLII
jgi:hypothetical protein